jgi:hypothetical protein
MPSKPALETELLDAHRSGDSTRVWNAYKALWNAGQAQELAPEWFSRLFYNGVVATEAIELMTRCPPAKAGIRAAAQHFPEQLDDNDIERVFVAVVSVDEALSQWKTRHREWPASIRQERAGSLVRLLLKQRGREWTRDQFVLLWRDGTIEEERESLLRALKAAGGELKPALLDQLGPEAWELAGHNGGGRSASGTLSRQLGGDTIASRLAAMLEFVRLPLDIRDSGLSPEELARVHSAIAPIWGPFFERTLTDLEQHSHQTWDLAQSLRQAASRLQGEAARSPCELRFSVLNLLHMRMLLEAPALADALDRPEEHLLPEVLLYVLGRDHVAYAPELRIVGGDRRWRARWVETTAEALAVIFLERALQIDLPTLARIPESTSETADFQAATIDGEPTIFETKGGTQWSTHQKQRKKALAQVRASLRSKGQGWSGDGRGFACCLLSATLGAQASSLLHIADPPLGPGAIFYDGWKEDARRRHYTAVAEAAGLFSLADYIARRGSPDRSPRHDAPSRGRGATEFAFGQDGDRRLIFIGTARRLEDEASVLRHPRSAQFRGVEMFAGISQSLYRRLERGELPERPLADEEQSAPVLTAAGTGQLPGEQGAPRGVYSLLSDGSFIAFSRA